MDAGQFWALAWLVGLVGLIGLGTAGNAKIDASPTGFLTGVCTGLFLLGTVACVWVASGLHFAVGVN